MAVERYPEPESNLLEFKKEIPKNDQIIRTVIGFCNQKGGKLILGVADDRTVVGLTDREINDLLEWLDQAIFDACHPPIIPTISTQRIGDKRIVVIAIASGMNKPYFRKSEGQEKGTYIRIGRSTMRANALILQELNWKSQRIDFEKLPVYQATMDEIDQDKVQHFLKERKNHAKAVNSQDILKSYSLAVEEHNKIFPTHAGILLFGKQTQTFFSEAMIICSHFQGIEGREAIASIDCEGTLFNQFYQAKNFVLSRLSHSFSIQGMVREEKLEIPEVAFREALLNLLIHRNYHLPSPSKIAIYDDRIELFSPGDFYGPLKPDDYFKGMTYLRNPAICKVFRELGLVEKMGTGFLNIFSSYDQWELPRPQIIEGANFVKCVLPRPTVERKQKEEQEILSLFQIQEEISLSDVMDKCSISRATAQRWVQQLIESGLIERVGQTRNVRYRKK